MWWAAVLWMVTMVLLPMNYNFFLWCFRTDPYNDEERAMGLYRRPYKGKAGVCDAE